MRSQLSQDLFFEKMKKKPALVEVLANLSSYDEDSINALKQPLWIKEQLIKRLYGRDESTILARAEAIADNAIVFVEQKINGSIFRWIGGNEIASGKHKFEIKPGTLLFYDKNGLWFGSTILKTPLEDISNDIEFVKESSRIEYIQNYT